MTRRRREKDSNPRSPVCGELGAPGPCAWLGRSCPHRAGRLRAVLCVATGCLLGELACQSPDSGAVFLSRLLVSRILRARLPRDRCLWTGLAGVLTITAPFAHANGPGSNMRSAKNVRQPAEPSNGTGGRAFTDLWSPWALEQEGRPSRGPRASHGDYRPQLCRLSLRQRSAPLRRGARAGFVDEALGGRLDGAVARRVDIKRAAGRAGPFGGCGQWLACILPCQRFTNGLTAARA